MSQRENRILHGPLALAVNDWTLNGQNNETGARSSSCNIDNAAARHGGSAWWEKFVKAGVEKILLSLTSGAMNDDFLLLLLSLNLSFSGWIFVGFNHFIQKIDIPEKTGNNIL
jgi:hypothetical protein